MGLIDRAYSRGFCLLLDSFRKIANPAVPSRSDFYLAWDVIRPSEAINWNAHRRLTQPTFVYFVTWPGEKMKRENSTSKRMEASDDLFSEKGSIT